MRKPVALFALFALALLSVAFAAQALALDVVIMADGRTRKAEILEVLEDGIRVKLTPKGGGTAKLTVPASKLDPHFFYDLRDDAVGDDAGGRLKLALWAFDAGLFSRSKIQVEKAAQLDPKLVADIREGKLPDIREGIARHVLTSAQKDIEKNRYELAEPKLQALLARMPDTEAGTEAVDVYKDLQAKLKTYEAEQEQKELDALAEEEKAKEKKLRKRVAPIKKDLERGKELLDAGLTEDSEAKSLKLLGQAIGKAEQGLKKLEKLRNEFPDDADLQAKAEDVTRRTIADMVNAHVQRTDIYVWRGSTRQATEELDKAWKLDPDNPDIAAAAQRIADRDNQDALDLRWQRARRGGGVRFRGGGVAGGGRGGGGRRR